nr:FAD-binding oxidoreductase [Brucella pituitosa]
MGHSQPFFLARAGHRVTVLEQGYVGAQSSGANFGNLRLQGRDVRQYPLSMRSQELWEQLDQLIGDTCEYDRSGHIYLACNDDEVAKLEAYAKNFTSVWSADRGFGWRRDTQTLSLSE